METPARLSQGNLTDETCRTIARLALESLVDSDDPSVYEVTTAGEGPRGRCR